jgi:hypothetical protein
MEEYAIKFKNLIHSEIRPLLAPALGQSPDAEHFRDKMQLRTLYHNLNDLADQIAKEEVICRYRKTRTARHVKLCANAEEAFENLRQLAVIFNLSH